VLDIVHLSKAYATAGGPVAALDDVTFSVIRGEIHGIIGRTGAGETTLIRCINLRPDASGAKYGASTPTMGTGTKRTLIE
jgi:D-methionine transport system ATP-binding protein